MAINPNYIFSKELEEYLVDKDTGLPLAFGTVTFWQDQNRVVPKPVFELTSNPPGSGQNYNYVALPNPIILSSVGTISDVNGNNIPIYYYPFDAAGHAQNYYIVVTNSLGVVQFVREAWPGQIADVIPGPPFPPTPPFPPVGNNTTISNVLSNPQFAQASFLPTNPYVFAFGGAGAFTIPFAPDWFLDITTGGAGDITLTRTAIAGNLGYPGNPPYTLTINPGANVLTAVLRQVLKNNPNVFAPAPLGLNGYLNASILLAPASQILSFQYQPSGQIAQTILVAHNLTANYQQFNATVQLTPVNNPATADTGFVNILVNLPIAAATTLGNLQIIALDTNIANIPYVQVAVNREIDQLFNYYSPLLNFKPIKSYLVGWDFPYNPAQFLGRTVAASAAGANTSQYVWDQTIIFQSANNGAAVATSASGSRGLQVTATNATQFALIQYLSQTDARKIINGRLSVNVSAVTSVVAGISGVISLWRGTGGALPSCAAGNSIVATLTPAGKPATFHNPAAGAWTEIPRSNLGDATFTIMPNATTNYNDYGFFGWDAQGVAGVDTATWFAIVVGFSQLPIGQTVDFDSISLVSGDIPTRPSYSSTIETLAECQYYYQKSFTAGTVPATGVGIGTGEYQFIAAKVGGGPNIGTGTLVYFQNEMITLPVITTFNPIFNDNLILNESSYSITPTALFANWLSVVTQISTRGVLFGGLVNAACLADETHGVHWTADSRLGV